MTINLAYLLVAIASVESGGNNLAVGKAGERSRFQISESVWRQHAGEKGVTAGDFATNAATHEVAHRVAEAHVVWLARQLEAHKRPVTVEALALAWHLGAVGERNGPHTPAQVDYAARVAALYAESVASQPKEVRFSLAAKP